MDGPVTLLLVVSLSGGEVQPAQLRATLAAHLDPQRVSLTLRGADGVQQLEQTLEAASVRGPVAVVTNPRRGELAIRAALQPGRWVSRTLSFAAHDPLPERNRTVALALVAMVPEWKLPTPLPEPAPTSLAAEVAVAPLTSADSAPPADAGLPIEPATVAAPADAGRIPEPVDAGNAELVPVAAAPPAVASSTALSIDLAGLAGYWPLAAGAQLGAHLCFSERLCAGLLLDAQTGSVPDTDARLYRVWPQATGRIQAPLGSERVHGALMLSVGPLWLQAIRDGEAQSRWQASVALDAEVALALGRWVSVFVRGGPTVVTGATPIVIDDSQVTELPVIAGRLAVGVRLNP